MLTKQQIATRVGQCYSERYGCFELAFDIYTNVLGVQAASLNELQLLLQTKAVPVAEVVLGDFLLMYGEQHNWHCGVAIDNKLFIHNYQAQITIISDQTSPYYKNKIEGVYRLPA